MVYNITKVLHTKLTRDGKAEFHTQFFRVEPEVCITELSRVTQRNGETIDLFISHFKKMRNKCKIHLPETEYVKMAQRGLDIDELAARVTKYEELLKEESYWRKKSMGTYYQEVNQEVAMVDLSTTGTFTCPLLVENTHNVWNKAQIVDA